MRPGRRTEPRLEGSPPAALTAPESPDWDDITDLHTRGMRHFRGAERTWA